MTPGSPPTGRGPEREGTGSDGRPGGESVEGTVDTSYTWDPTLKEVDSGSGVLPDRLFSCVSLLEGVVGPQGLREEGVRTTLRRMCTTQEGRGVRENTGNRLFPRPVRHSVEGTRCLNRPWYTCVWVPGSRSGVGVSITERPSSVRTRRESRTSLKL